MCPFKKKASWKHNLNRTVLACFTLSHMHKSRLIVWALQKQLWKKNGRPIDRMHCKSLWIKAFGKCFLYDKWYRTGLFNDSFWAWVKVISMLALASTAYNMSMLVNICEQEKKQKKGDKVNVKDTKKVRRFFPSEYERVNDWQIFSERDRNGMREGKSESQMKWALPLTAFWLRAFLSDDDVMRTGPGQTGLLMFLKEEGLHSLTSRKEKTIYHFHTAHKYVRWERSSDPDTNTVCVSVWPAGILQMAWNVMCY